MTPVYLLRHGATEASLLGSPLGRTDQDLCEEGRLLWPGVKRHLLSLEIRLVLTSPLRRAREYAEQLGLRTEILSGLGEQDFGAWEGIPWALIPEAEPFFSDPVFASPPGGESYEHCARRAIRSLREVWEPETATLVLAHAGPLRAIAAHWLGLSLQRSLDLSWQPFGLTRFDVVDFDRGILKYHNWAEWPPVPL